MKRCNHPCLPAALALTLTLPFLGGCGDVSGRSSVQGNVTIDGEPVDGGAIVFIPEGESGQRVPAGGEIVGGKYSLPAERGPSPGKCRVEITWKKKTGRQIVSPNDAPNKIDETVQVVPIIYNSSSTLKEDVQPGANTFNYTLKGAVRGGVGSPGSGVPGRVPAKGD
jgi:hypothetical protein